MVELLIFVRDIVMTVLLSWAGFEAPPSDQGDDARLHEAAIVLNWTVEAVPTLIPADVGCPSEQIEFHHS